MSRINNIPVLINKSIKTIKEEGFNAFVVKSLTFVTIHLHIKKQLDPFMNPCSYFMDVLFINGCYLPHPSRYRVEHQREQLYANGIVSNVVFYDNLTIDLVKNYRCFIFFRCPSTEKVIQFIEFAKKNNKTVLFDIDDLVIDTKYTDKIKYVQSMSDEEKEVYDDGVNRMQETLRMCDAAITTTNRLASELRNYVPEVFINRNTASERMVELSLEAIQHKNEINSIRKAQNSIIIGYFSGSITHNDDIQMISPVLNEILSEHPNVFLYLAGELDMPQEFILFKDQIILSKFEDWEKLPAKIASVDINIVPLEDTIFNQAKSENKWVEASLVKVPTIASRVGAFEQMIENGVTGILCNNNNEWYDALNELINNEEKRISLAENAFQYAIKHCTTIYTGYPLTKYIKNKLKPNIAFVLPSLNTSGGVLVALEHCRILRKAGYDVLLIDEGVDQQKTVQINEELPAINKNNTAIHGSFDKVIATLWTTVSFLALYPNIKQRYYLVQNFETDFYLHGQLNKKHANQTYNVCFPLKYITISRWCQKWLKEDFEKNASYAPNGLDIELFQPQKRSFNEKIRILVEGNSKDYYKNVDESFRIVERLPPEKFEIWYMSYLGEPKPWYRVDKILINIPHDEVVEIYRQCHILLKSSILESFSYPPLEMMATGGFAVVAKNEGNSEYLIDGENCLLYKTGDIEGALNAIERICSDETLRNNLFENGLKTAQSRSWKNIEKEILRLYDIYEDSYHEPL